jgi:hypothetical protein
MNTSLRRNCFCITTTFALVCGVGSSAAANAADDLPGASRIVRWLNNRSLPHLNVSQAEAYAQQQQRQASALLAAYQVSSERAFLREAITKYPRNPPVALAAACFPTEEANPDTVQQRRQWLDTFKMAAPDNALAYYLSAREHFRTGQPDLAEKEVTFGAGKPVQDYGLTFIEHAEAAYRSAGYSEHEAVALAMASLLMPHLAHLRELGNATVSRANHHRDNGKADFARELLLAVVKMGSQLDTTNALSLLQNMVGINIQQNALKQLEPDTVVGTGTAQSEMARLTQRLPALRRTAKDFNKLFEAMSDPEVGTYFNQQKRVGEEAADRYFLANAK